MSLVSRSPECSEGLVVSCTEFDEFFTIKYGDLDEFMKNLFDNLYNKIRNDIDAQLRYTSQGDNGISR
jgi:hypothetical protein